MFCNKNYDNENANYNTCGFCYDEYVNNNYYYDSFENDTYNYSNNSSRNSYYGARHNCCCNKKEHHTCCPSYYNEEKNDRKKDDCYEGYFKICPKHDKKEENSCNNRSDCNHNKRCGCWWSFCRW